MRSGMRLRGNQSRRGWRRAWVTIALIIVTLVAGIQLTRFGAPTPMRAAQAAGVVEVDVAGEAMQATTTQWTTTQLATNQATTSQATLEQAAERKGVIWLPHLKWATAEGYNWAGIEGDLQDMNTAGIGWVRIFLHQDVPLEFHDQLVPLIAQYNIQLLPVLKKSDPFEDLGTPEQQEAYRQWVTEVVTRYQSTVRYWEIENETNIPQGWAICCHDDPDGNEAYVRGVESYVALLKMAYETIKAIDPTLQVLIAGICEASAERYVGELIRLEAHQYFDIMSFHPFGGRPDFALERLDALKATMAQDPALAAKPIWITAIGYHAQANWTAPGKVADEGVKAEYLLQAMQLLREAPGVEGPLFWYALSEPSLVNGYGLVQINPNTTPPTRSYLPAYTAFQELWVTKYVKILTTTADSFVSKNYPTANYGGAIQLKIGYGTDVREAHLKFDLSSLAGYTLLQTQLRFLTANTKDAGSAGSQSIRMAADPDWAEGAITYNNRLSSVLGTIANTAQGKGYHITLDSTILQQIVGEQLILTIDSQSADELVIQSREWQKNPPKLIIYYTDAIASASSAPDVVAPSAEELPPIEAINDNASQVEDLYAWSIGDPYSGYPYEMWDDGEPGKTEKSEQGAEEPAIYLPFVEQ